MALPATPLPTLTFEDLYEQIRALPQGVTGEILKPGVLRTMSRPGRPHRHAHSVMKHHLGGLDRNVGGAGWWIEVEAEIRFPQGRLLVPDLSGFRVERVPELPDENPLTVLPDWVCEVLSPSTERVDLTVKLPLYAQAGVPWIWIVNPSSRILEVFETIDGRPALTAFATDEPRATLPPFGDVDLTGLWLSEPSPA